MNAGVALQLRYFGGDVLEEEVREAMKEQIQIPTGFNIVTGAGNLRTKYLIHSVGPNTHDEAQSGLDHEKLLTFTARNFFIQAAHYKCNSLAVPAISCGEYGFSVKTCAKLLFDSIKMFQMGYEEGRNARTQYPD